MNFYMGAYLYSSVSNTFRNNTLSSNWKGIYLDESDYNTIDSNTLESNTNYGIYIGNSDYNYIYYNRLCNNSMYDMYLDYSSGNSGYENTCDEPDGWNDSLSGCTYDCSAVTTTTTISTSTTSTSTTSTLVAGETTCSNCSDCTAKLNGDYDTVKLTADISSSWTCIEFDTNGTEFDCQGHMMDGGEDNWGYGIYISEKSTNTVKNCIITNFYRGVYLHSSVSNTFRNNTISGNWKGIFMEESDYNTIDSNTADSNTDYGLFIFNSDYNYIYYNRFCDNSMYDILLDGSSGNSGYENTCDSPDGWNDSLSGCTYDCSAVTTTTTTTLTTSTSSTTTTMTTTTSTSTTSTIVPFMATATRDLPLTAQPGSTVNVTIALDVNESNPPNSVIIKEYFHPGWNVTGSEPTANSVNSSGGEIKWILTAGEVIDRVISYLVEIPSDETGIRTFYGELLYNDDQQEPLTLLIGGDTYMNVSEECPKGDEDCDGTVSDFELLDYVDQWVQGLVNDFDLLAAIDNWAG